MKNVFAAAVMVLGMTVGANAHEPCQPRVRLTSPECVVCHCNSFVVNRHYVGRGVWNYSKGVGGRAWNGLKTFATAALQDTTRHWRRWVERLAVVYKLTAQWPSVYVPAEL